MTLEPGQAQTEVIVGEIQLSMATMESRGCLGIETLFKLEQKNPHKP